MRGERDPIVRRAHVEADDAPRAVAALAAALGSPQERGPERGSYGVGGDADWRALVVFASIRFDADTIARELEVTFPGVSVIGCTSHGEISDGGDHSGTLAAMAIATPRIRIGLGIAPDLARSALRSSRSAVADAAGMLDTTPDALSPARHVGIALVDGRSGFEESFCLGSAATAPQIRFVGGSASDDFGEVPRARVFFGGRAHAGSGVVGVLETDLPFAVIESEHMVPTDQRIVVTAAEPERRRVLEIDGRPAAARYAEMLGAFGVPAPDSTIASSFPFALYVGGRPYVRSVIDVDGDALVMASAVDPGAILRLMRAGDLVGSTRRALAAAADEVGGDLRGVIAFSCLGRHREATTSGTRAALAELYDELPLVGFHSFGEQAGPLLVNHTLTGLALGGARG